MKFSTRARKFIATVTLITVVPVLAACGGGEEESTPVQQSSGLSPGAAVFCGILFTFIDGSCVPDSGSSTSGDTTVQPENIWVSLTTDELEPNNTIENAQPLSFPIRKSEGVNLSAWARGTVNDQNDLVDSYMLMVPETRDYGLSLRECGVDCYTLNSVPMDINTAFFRFLDQDGNVLFSSKDNYMGSNWVVTQLDVGVVYYVTVHARYTGSLPPTYRFSASQQRQ